MTVRESAYCVKMRRQDSTVKIICIGRNYAEHAAELGDEPPAEPLLFGKFENTLIGPGEAIVLPPEATHVDAEAELVRRDRPDAAAASRRTTRSTCRAATARANDVSARNLQYADKQWTRGKGFDTFCPLGDRLVPVFGARRRRRPRRSSA